MMRFVFLILFCPFALGATYHVAKTGNDTTGDGSSGTPWLTIQKAANMVTAGDTVTIHAGTYYEAITLPTTCFGTAGHPITFQRDGSETVILDGTEALTGWTQCASDEPGLTVQGSTNANYASIYKTSIATSRVPLAGGYINLSKFNLFENAVCAHICRTPDQVYGYGLNTALFTPLENEGGNWNQDVYLVDSSALTQADDYWNGAFVSVMLSRLNANTNNRVIADFDQSDSKITFGIYYYGGSTTTADLDATLSSDGSSPDSYSIWNHPMLIDEAGEYYITPTATGGYYTLYYWPTTAGDPDTSGTSVAIPTKTYGIYAASHTQKHDYILIDGLTIRGYTLTGILVESNNAADLTTGWTIQNCTIKACGSDGIRFTYSDTTIVQNCTVDVTGGSGIFFQYGSNATAYHNTVGNSTETNIRNQHIDHLEVTENDLLGCVGSHGNGVSAYYGCSEVLIAKNIFHNDSNLAFNYPTNVFVYANAFYCHALLSTLIASWADSSIGSKGYFVYLNNTVAWAKSNNAMAPPGRAIWLAGRTYTPTPTYDETTKRDEVTMAWDSTDYYHCILEHLSSLDNKPGTGASWETYWEVSSTPPPKSYIVNNIVDGVSHEANKIEYHDYNFWTGKLWTQTTARGWTDGANEINLGTDSLSTVFVDYLNDDLRLAASSPVIGQGVSYTTELDTFGIDTEYPTLWAAGYFTKDITGRAWASPPAMGAYETGAYTMSVESSTASVQEGSALVDPATSAAFDWDTTGETGTVTFTVATTKLGEAVSVNPPAINSGTGVVTWTPTASPSQAGVYVVTVTATDETPEVLTRTLTVTVSAAPLGNSDPVLSGIGKQTVISGVAWSKDNVVTDADGGLHTWTMTGNPVWLSINSSTGQLSGTPPYPGRWSVRVTVSDGTATDYEDVIIEVTTGIYYSLTSQFNGILFFHLNNYLQADFDDAITSRFVTQVLVYTGNRHDSDHITANTAKLAYIVSTAHTAGKKVILCRNLWPTTSAIYDSTILYSSAYYAAEIAALKTLKTTYGVDAIAFDMEAYGGEPNPVEDYLSWADNFDPSDEQDTNLSAAVAAAVAAQGQVDYVYPAGSVRTYSFFNLLDSLGSRGIITSTYYAKVVDISNQISGKTLKTIWLGLYVNTTKPNGDNPFYLSNQIQKYVNTNITYGGVFIYPKENNYSAVVDDLITWSKK